MLAAIKAYALPAALIVTVLAIMALGYSVGHTVAKGKGDAALAEMAADRSAALAAAEVQARKKEGEIRAELYALEQQYTTLEEEANRARQADARLINDLRTGARRMSIAVKSCGTRDVPDDGANDPESGASGAQRAELDPAVTESLLAIARDGDKYIRERNACIQQYEIVRRRMNTREGATEGNAVGE